MISGPHLGIDETTLQVLAEPERRNTSKSSMWVFRYSPTRSCKAALPIIDGYTGIIQSDGYGVYDVITRKEKLMLAGCQGSKRGEILRTR